MQNTFDNEGFGSIVRGILNANAVDAELRLQVASQSLSTGFQGTPPSLSINPGDTTKFDMTAGVIEIVDNTSFPAVVSTVTVPAITAGTITNIATQEATFFSIDVTGIPVQRSGKLTAEQRRSEGSIGVLLHIDNVNILAAINIPQLVINPWSQFADLVMAIGFFSTSGNQLTGVSSVLKLNKSTGSGFALNENAAANKKDPHNINLPALTPATMFQNLQTGDLVVLSDTLDPTTYDNAGVLTTVPANNNATISYAYLFPNNVITLLKGQEVFSTFSAAKDAAGTETVVVPALEQGDGLLLARIIMKKNATDATDTSEFFILPSANISGGGASITSLQQAYDISVQPLIETDSTRLEFSVQRGSGSDSDLIYSGRNGAGVRTFTVDGDGNIIAASLSVSTLGAAPASASASGVTGTIIYTSDFIYTCIASNTWKRVAIATW